MNKERMKAYYETYNRSVDEALSTFYTDDAVFEYQDVKLNGKEEIINHFSAIQQAVKEVMKPISILVDGEKAAVEVENTFEAKVDLPDFLGRSLKAGESFTGRFSGFYDTRGDEICHIRLYNF